MHTYHLVVSVLGPQYRQPRLLVSLGSQDDLSEADLDRSSALWCRAT